MSSEQCRDPVSTPLDGRGAVLKLRDELLQLVTAYNAVGSYLHAQKAQAMAVALNKFEDDVIITHMAWPPRVEQGEYGPFIPDLDGDAVDCEER